MIREGEPAPQFELPAVVDGEFEPVALSSYLGTNVVVLAFYPADFNPACEDGTTDLDELDLFTMQKDVDVLAVSADSLYSHLAFAEEFDLHIPLLADTHGTVAADYGVDVGDPTAGYRTHRAVFVVGPEGDVEFAWATEDLTELPPVDAIRESVDEVGGAETALARYRVGHAHYVEGRRSFTSAMHGFQDEEWMVARSDFERASEEFEAAAAQFDSAVRFGDDEHSRQYYRLAEEKAELLWQAGEWLAEAANAYASGEGAQGQSVRADAERTLEDARDIFEPPDPDEFPPEEDPAGRLAAETDDGESSIVPGDEADVDASLDVDLDETGADQGTADPDAQDAAPDAEADADPDARDAAPDAEADAPDARAEAPGRDGGAEDEAEIGTAELEEITAELEEQTEAARERRGPEAAESDAEAAGDEGDPGAADEPGPGGADEDGSGAAGEDEDLELDLTDPTGGEGLEPIEDDEDDEDDEDEGDEDDEATDEDLGGDDHGVPDSL